MPKTIMVLGAGASKEANLPAGLEIRHEIRDLLDIRFDMRQVSGDPIIAEAMRVYRREEGQDGNISPLVYDAWRIRDAISQAQSIDHFVNAHRDKPHVALCAKLAICRAILSAERNSKLVTREEVHQPLLNFDSLADTWYTSFFQVLIEGCSEADLEERFRNLVLIIFNYDRCVEHYLFHQLQNYFRITEQQAADLVKSIEIFHPYGVIGDLPWFGDEVRVEFGAKAGGELLLRAASRIKTFSEGTDPQDSDIAAIRDHMATADRLIFLGFAFHPINLEILSPRDIDQPEHPLLAYATTLGISDSDQQVIKRWIQKMYVRETLPNLSNGTCFEFFQEYWRSLSFT